MSEINDLSTSAASNTGQFPNGMDVNQLNDAAREDQAMTAREFKDRTGQGTTAGTGVAYTYIPYRAVTAYTPGLVFYIRFHVACGDNPMFSAGGLASKNLRRQTGTNILNGDISSGQLVFVSYNAAADKFDCLGIGDSTASNGMPQFTKTTLPATTDTRMILVTDEVGGSVTAFSDGANWRRTTDRAIVS